MAGAAALLAAPLAQADPNSGAAPPSCSSADLEGVRAGVDASTSAYLFTHPDLNAYMSTLQGLTREQVARRVTTYMSSHPQESAEMAGIRQPLVDLKNNCGATAVP
ncbi:heme-binding protein [Mycolicibacterium celeriflavum]|uniref:heme-binding protein n=1 Tax=Mycolicibacterium celeriflavum TaxID=1249101 RepID=UPI003CEA50D5